MIYDQYINTVLQYYMIYDRTGDPRERKAEDGPAAAEVESEGGAELPQDDLGLRGRVQLQGGALCLGQVSIFNIFLTVL